MLRFGVADEVSILLPVVVLHSESSLIAVAVAQLVQKFISAVLDRPIAQRIHRILTAGRSKDHGRRSAQHWSLIAQPQM